MVIVDFVFYVYFAVAFVTKPLQAIKSGLFFREIPRVDRFRVVRLISLLHFILLKISRTHTHTHSPLLSFDGAAVRVFTCISSLIFLHPELQNSLPAYALTLFTRLESHAPTPASLVGYLFK